MKLDFFQVISIAEFRKIARGFPQISGVCAQPVEDCLDRVLAQELKAKEDLPPFNRSSMDGYAVVSADTYGCSEANPAYLQNIGEIYVDSQPEFSLEPGKCAKVATGSVVPEGSDAVVMLEYTHSLSDEDIEIHRSVAPGENLMLQGEDCRQDQTVLQPGMRLRPQEIGLAAALGFDRIQVYKRPRVGVISTGDELVPVNAQLKPGKIRDVNSYSLHAWILKSGAIPVVYGIFRDDLQQIKNILHKALDECDLILISGGSSVGTADLTLQALQNLPDPEILAHGVAISPGKPTILARSGEKCILGLPGQVTSVQVVMYVLGISLIRHIGAEKEAIQNQEYSFVQARLAKNIPSKQGREDYVRARLEVSEDGDLQAHPVLGKSGLINTLIQADGLIRIPAQSEGLLQDSLVRVYQF